MYRLLKLQKLSSRNSQVLSLPLTNFVTRTCAFCNHNFVLKAPKDASSFSVSYPVRMQSTHTKTNAIHLLAKKKKRKLKKKYAELVEVTEGTSMQKKASVSKLTSKQISLLAAQPDINLNELFQLKKVKNHSNSNDTNSKNEHGAMLFIPPEMSADSVRPVIESSMPSLHQMQSSCDRNTGQEFQTRNDSSFCTYDSSGQIFTSQENVGVLHDFNAENINMLCESDVIAQELKISVDDPEVRAKLIQDGCVPSHQGSVMEDTYDLHDVEVDHVEVTHEEDTRKKTEKQSGNLKSNLAKQRIAKQKEMDILSRSETLTRCLISYMDVCVACGFLNRGLSTLLYYRQQRRGSDGNKVPKVINIKPYNVLLQGFAGKGNLSKVKEVLQIVTEDKLTRTLETYASVFECVGRLPRSDSSIILLKKWLCDLDIAGWTLNDVMVKNVFVADQREVILKAFRLLHPNFTPEYPPPDTCYSCELLRELNGSEKRQGYHTPVRGVLDEDTMKTAVKEQFLIERNDHVKVKSIEKREESSKTINFYREKLLETEDIWRKELDDAFKREIETLRAQQKHFHQAFSLNLYPYLRVLDSSVYVDIIMKEIRRLAEGSETFSPTTSQLYRSLGVQVQTRYEIEYKRSLGVLSKIEELYGEYCNWFVKPSGSACNPREQWQSLISSNSDGPSADIAKKTWPAIVLISIGRYLYSFILKDLKIDVNIVKPNSGNNKHFLPAFYTLFRNHGRILKEEVKPHPALARLYRNAALEHLVFDVNLVPMLSPPIPWTTALSAVGAYVVSHAELVRLPHLAFQQKERLEKAPQNQLYASLDALNQLGSVPWTVNESVLDVVLDVFNRGGSPRLDIPQPPSFCPQPTAVTPDMSRPEKMKAFQERIMLRRRRAEMYSLWCDALYRLSLANHYRKRVFWLPHNMDFRGRVYPCPPHLNHLGSDMARSLLQFAQGQALGPKGLDWLMIHLINLTGLKKRDSVEKRLAFAKSIVPKILDSADRPLTGEMWWASNEDPWQVLATCMEIAKAIRSGNPETFVSRFPVHQDGSCNGLQHYAALGRDAAGAASVNLTPASSPQDVYSCVAALVEKQRIKDAAAGVKIAQILDGFIRRKVIKQTVMTTVYGVTRYGARLQIARQLKDIEEFPKESIWQGSSYLVNKTFGSIQEMFTSTKEIQDWFTVCARYIAQVCGENVEWVTPLGLPVVQPYVRIARRSNHQTKSHKLNEHFAMDIYEKPNVLKQKNAFPPNFIHSLDSSHMMLTSILCEREGITFVSVHDCYWTHPCSVDTMNKICREQFVALHSQPILEDLSQFLCEKFGSSDSLNGTNSKELNILLKSLPIKGDFDLTNILKSVYFFS